MAQANTFTIGQNSNTDANGNLIPNQSVTPLAKSDPANPNSPRFTSAVPIGSNNIRQMTIASNSVNNIFLNTIKNDSLIQQHLFLVEISLIDNSSVDKTKIFVGYQIDKNLLDLRLLTGDIDPPSLQIDQNVNDIINTMGKSTFNGKNAVDFTNNTINAAIMNSNNNMFHEKMFRDWIKNSSTNKFNGMLKCELNIMFGKNDALNSVLNPVNALPSAPILIYTFHNCYPIKIDSLKPDHKTVSQQCYRNITFKFEGFEVI